MLSTYFFFQKSINYILFIKLPYETQFRRTEVFVRRNILLCRNFIRQDSVR